MSAGERRGAFAAQRRRARVLALQMLFEADFGPAHVDEILGRRLAEEETPAPVAAYAETLLRGAWAHRAEYDALIARTAPSWPVDQMARIDRNILRLAMYELLESEQVPVKAVINEAVELAKEFGSDASRRFVNGVLGTIAAERAERRNGEPVAPGEQ